MYHHLHESLPSLNGFYVVVQISAKSTSAVPGATEKNAERDHSGSNKSNRSSDRIRALNQDQWEDVVQNRSILCGIRMETRLSSRLGPDVSGVPLVNIRTRFHCHGLTKGTAGFPRTNDSPSLSRGNPYNQGRISIRPNDELYGGWMDGRHTQCEPSIRICTPL
jgi:hypothetical protein